MKDKFEMLKKIDIKRKQGQKKDRLFSQSVLKIIIDLLSYKLSGQ